MTRLVPMALPAAPVAPAAAVVPAAAVLLAAVVLLAAGCAGASTPVRSASSPPAQRTPAASHSIAGTGVVSRHQPACTTATESAPALAPAATAMTTVLPPERLGVPPEPFGVAITAGGRWAFASIGGDLGVLQLSPGHPARLIRSVALPEPTAGVALTPDGRLLLLAGGSGAVVVSVAAAEQGSGRAVLGELSVPVRPGPAGAIEIAVSRDSRYAFVSLEDNAQVAVFDLATALADRFRAGYVGVIPAQVAPVGLAVSPDGRWLYSTSEVAGSASEIGTLEVISVPRAESHPATSVVVRVPAGCNPVRVITSADGAVVWVTARASDALLAFSAARLRTDPQHSLLADVRVGEAPVGLALARDGSLAVVADSDRFGATGQAASLAVVGVADALAGHPALLGYLQAGRFPRDMAAGPGGDIVLVANFASDQLETVNAAALP